MASKKSVAPPGPKPRPAKPPRPGKQQSSIEVDTSWLEQLSEEEKPKSRLPRPAPPPPPASKRGAAPPPPPASKRGAAPPPTKHESGETIDVNSSWLIPSMPPGKLSPPPRPPPPPAVIAVKPRGKLPPPLPRDDDEPKR